MDGLVYNRGLFNRSVFDGKCLVELMHKTLNVKLMLLLKTVRDLRNIIFFCIHSFTLKYIWLILCFLSIFCFEGILQCLTIIPHFCCVIFCVFFKTLFMRFVMLELLITYTSKSLNYEGWGLSRYLFTTIKVCPVLNFVPLSNQRQKHKLVFQTMYGSAVSVIVFLWIGILVICEVFRNLNFIKLIHYLIISRN